MKNSLLPFFFLSLSLSAILPSCQDDEIVIVPAPKPNIPEGSLQDGFNYSSKQPDADQPLTITFKAGSSSALFNYTGEVYLHTGVITEGQWQFVPADWNENLEKCKMTPSESEPNVWSIELTPSIREWFNSGTTPVTRLGVIARSEDGSKKGIDSDLFVDITDHKYTSFIPGEIKEKSRPDNVIDGININPENQSVTLVLYDKDTEGKHKEYAHVIGDFNDWTLSNDEKSQMYRDEATGCWWITLTDLDPTKEYRFQYYLGTQNEGSMRLADPYSEKVLDPNNDKYIPASTYPAAEMAYPEQGIGIVSTFKIQQDEFGWQHTDFKIKHPENLIIYELHLRDFTKSGDLNGAMEKLEYLKQLGVNAIELMPVQEFDGNDSWGYNPCFFFAMDKAYGTKEKYKQFIDECHNLGIAVILDVVYNHATGAHPFARLYWDSEHNKTASNNPWFNIDAPHPYSVFHDFNHESPLTRAFVKRNLEFLLEEYKVDGFRFDLTKGFTNTPSDESSVSNYDQSRVNILTEYYRTIKAKNPDAVMICEHLAGIEEESALSKVGMLLWRNVNHAYCQSAMGYSDGSNFSGLTTWNTTMKENGWIGYMESHDEERCGYKQLAYSPENIKSDLNIRMKRLETNAAFFFTVSGPKMIWQFGELGYDISINANSNGEVIEGEDHRTDRKPIRWEYAEDPDRHELYTTYSRLIQLRKDFPEVFSQTAFKEWRVSDNDWNNGRYIKLETTSGKKLIVAGNFSSQDITMDNVFPSTGTWYNFSNGKEETISSTSIEVPAHSFKLYTNFSTIK